MKRRHKICRPSLVFTCFLLLFARESYSEITSTDLDGPKDAYGEPIPQKVVRKETNLDRFEKSFEEADYAKLGQAERAMALKNAFLSTVIKLDDAKEDLLPEQIRKRQVFMNQHFYQIPDETRSAIYRETLPIVTMLGDQTLIEKFFAEANRYTPQETGKLLCSQIQALDSYMPRGFGQSQAKFSLEEVGSLHPITKKFSGLVKKDLSMANYECKTPYTDAPMKVSQILATIEKSYDKRMAAETRISTQQTSIDITQNSPQFKDCSEKEVRALYVEATQSFVQKSASGKTSQGYYMGSQQGCRFYGYVTNKDGKFQLYLNSSIAKTDKPFVITSSQDAVDQLKFLWAESRKPLVPPAPATAPASASGGAGFNPFGGTFQKPKGAK